MQHREKRKEGGRGLGEGEFISNSSFAALIRTERRLLVKIGERRGKYGIQKQEISRSFGSEIETRVLDEIENIKKTGGREGIKRKDNPY